MIKNTDIETNTLFPVPLHPRRERKRGFNQAIVLAKAIGTITNQTIYTNQSKRIIHTRQQASLKRAQRQKNLNQAFSCKPGLRHVIIIDDVFTTGSTTRSYSQCLKKAGYVVTEIWCLCVSSISE